MKHVKLFEEFDSIVNESEKNIYANTGMHNFILKDGKVLSSDDYT